MADDTGTTESTSTTTEAPEPAASTSPAPAAATELPPMGDETDETDWHPPQRLADGTPVDGHGLPINLRLRKAALADAGKDSDPEGYVTGEDIAAEVERLAAYDADYPALRANMKTAELEKIAKAEEVDLSAAQNNEDRVAAIAAARPARV